MNDFLKKSLTVMLLASGIALVAADLPKAAAAKPAPPRSIFVIPSVARDGRDPFFPESSRVYDENPTTQRHAVDENSFKVKGISYEHGRAMVIVNNHTFAIGDEGDVLTDSGRVHLRVTDITPDFVTIEVNGSKRQLSTNIR